MKCSICSVGVKLPSGGCQWSSSLEQARWAILASECEVLNGSLLYVLIGVSSLAQEADGFSIFRAEHLQGWAKLVHILLKRKYLDRCTGEVAVIAPYE